MRFDEKTKEFRGTIGQNIPCSREEMEEDLLETLYQWWRDARELEPREIARELAVSRRELRTLTKRMVQHGYLEETEREEPDSVLRELADSATKGDTVRLGSFKKMNAQDMYEIYKAANHA